MIVAYKTESAVAEITLLSDAAEVVDSYVWQADRKLSEDILTQTKGLLTRNGQVFADITGIGVYAGPGSFTGLRISHTVANALAYSLDVPVANSGSDDWLTEVVSLIGDNPDNRIVVPDYGREARITIPKK